MKNSLELLQQIASLLIYQSVFKNELGIAYIALLEQISSYSELKKNNRSTSSFELSKAYGHWFKLIAATHKSWQDHLINGILQDDNPFTRQVQKTSIEQLPESLIIAVKQDLQILLLYSTT